METCRCKWSFFSARRGTSGFCEAKDSISRLSRVVAQTQSISSCYPHDESRPLNNRDLSLILLLRVSNKIMWIRKSLSPSTPSSFLSFAASTRRIIASVWFFSRAGAPVRPPAHLPARPPVLPSLRFRFSAHKDYFVQVQVLGWILWGPVGTSLSQCPMGFSDL